MSVYLKGFLGGGLYVLCNYIIANLPCWALRKALYRLLGMKIGRHSRIMMKTVVTHPWKIAIGDNTTVNEYCYLDGRGGLTLGDNVNIALRSMFVTGTHDSRSATFDYYCEPITVEDNVWVAANAMVLNGCILREGSVICAGAVVSPRTECPPWRVYGGVPAKNIAARGFEGSLDLSPWRVCFR